ncbi:hypothetical protein CTM88_20680 [Photobacterium aquimaris]|uniref:Uncharacterized protein n=1 Tax=Photobacterium aquimaris TaxID=512643 RepID=A0A2T3IEE1_9GAMM|nr:hypothetical protein [Photobacterium aquimaris]OBU19978.1 hypothetical protein AYY20_16735 [Photobacterium aquimaris]PSU21752.1 hypothetical protein CTM88_20680 [Photobacterium aquimaris]
MFGVSTDTHQLKMKLADDGLPPKVKYHEKQAMINRFRIEESTMNLLQLRTDIASPDNIDDSAVRYVLYGNLIDPEDQCIFNMIMGVRTSLLVTFVNNLEQLNIIPNFDIKIGATLSADDIQNLSKQIMPQVISTINWKLVDSHAKDCLQTTISLCSMLYIQNFGYGEFYRIYKKSITDNKLLPYFENFTCALFDKITATLDTHTLDALLTIMDLQNDTRLSYLDDYQELNWLQESLRLSYSFANFVAEIDVQAECIDNIVKDEIKSKINNVTTEQDKKSQKIRSAHANLLKAIDTLSLNDQNNDMITILSDTINSIKCIDGNNDSIDKLKNEMKAFIDAGQFSAVKESINNIEKLESRQIEARVFKFNKILDSINTPDIIKAPHYKVNIDPNNPFDSPSNTEEDKLLLSIAEDEIQEKSAKLNKAYDSIALLTNEIDKLKLQISMDRTLTPSMAKFVYGKPSIYDTFNCIREIFPAVIFSDDIEQQISNCKYTDSRKLFRTLELICGDYFNAIISGKPDSVAKNVFSCNGYSQDESKSVRNSKALYSKRIFSINGQQEQFGRHFTLGGDINMQKTVQIYFKIVDSKMYIGYIGKHLPLE